MVEDDGEKMMSGMEVMRMRVLVLFR